MDFAEHSLSTAQGLLKDGYKPPFHVVFLWRNGAMLYYRFTVHQEEEGLGLEAEKLAEHGEKMLEPPINELWVDANGATRHVVIEDSEPIRFSLN